jgi:hypothetical protein
MRYLNKVIFLNSAHVPYAEVKLDGNVHFIGTQGNHLREVPMAGIMKFYDVLNRITVFSKIHPIKVGEKSIVAQHIESIPENSLSIYDRGFASFSLMYLLIHQEKTKHFGMQHFQD